MTDGCGTEGAAAYAAVLEILFVLYAGAFSVSRDIQLVVSGAAVGTADGFMTLLPRGGWEAGGRELISLATPSIVALQE